MLYLLAIKTMMGVEVENFWSSLVYLVFFCSIFICLFYLYVFLKQAFLTACTKLQNDNLKQLHCYRNYRLDQNGREVFGFVAWFFALKAEWRSKAEVWQLGSWLMPQSEEGNWRPEDFSTCRYGSLTFWREVDLAADDIPPYSWL